MSRILLFGKSGQLGQDIFKVLNRTYDVKICSRESLGKLSDMINLLRIIDKNEPDIIINCVAYTNVDKAETEKDLVHEVNTLFPENLSYACALKNIFLIHFSTDSVFDGFLDRAYSENDTPNPMNAYASSKFMAENCIKNSGCNYLILRVAWLFSLNRNNFIIWVLQKIKETHPFPVVIDQIGTPTWTYSVAKGTYKVINKLESTILYNKLPFKEVYHLCSDNYCSKYELAKEILKIKNINESVLFKISSEELRQKAKRPLKVILNNQKLKNDFGFTIENWEIQLAKCLRHSLNL